MINKKLMIIVLIILSSILIAACTHSKVNTTPVNPPQVSETPAVEIETTSTSFEEISAPQVFTPSQNGFGFHDEEEGDSGVRAATLDLKVNGQDNPSVLFMIGNLVPGDSGTKTITVENAGSIPGGLSIVMNYGDDEGSNPEPETDKSEPGDLSKYTNITVSYGNQVLINNTRLSDISGFRHNLNVLDSKESRTMKVEYAVSYMAGNDIQGDIISYNFDFKLVQL